MYSTSDDGEAGASPFVPYCLYLPEQFKVDLSSDDIVAHRMEAFTDII